MAWPAGALYGTGYALSQLSGPVLLTFIGTADDRGFWFGVCLLIAGSLLLLGQRCAQGRSAQCLRARFVGLLPGLPAIAWAVVLFAAFEAMILTLLPVYGLRQGFPQAVALAMVSTVVVGDALLQLPIGWLADRVSRSGLFGGCGLVLLLSSLAILLLQTPLIWPLLVLFGASAGGLFTLALILIGERYRDDALVRANAHVAQLWGIGCLLGPLATGAARWISGHALPLMMALGAAGFVVLVRLRGAIPADDEAIGLEASSDPQSIFSSPIIPATQAFRRRHRLPARGAGPGSGRRVRRSRPASAGYRCGRCAPGSWRSAPCPPAPVGGPARPAADCRR